METVSPQIVLLAAMQLEAAALERTIMIHGEASLSGKRFQLGNAGGWRVALSACGVGKVNAAQVSTLALCHWQPAAVLVAGVAGGLHPEVGYGDIVLVEQSTHHDFGIWTDAGFRELRSRNPWSWELNPQFFPADAQWLQRAEQACSALRLDSLLADAGVPQIRRGTLVTGDIAVNPLAQRRELHQRLGAIAVDMESVAIAQVCWNMNVPCLIIRGISDTEQFIPADFQADAAEVMIQVARVVQAILEATPADEC